MADEETTDVAEDGESGAADKGKKKAAKVPKAEKEPKPEKNKDKKKKDPKAKGEKGGGAGGIILIMLLVLIILVGGFAAALYFDIFSAREIIGEVITEPLLNIIIWLDPGFSSINARLDAERVIQETRFQERLEEFNERETDIEILENILINRESMLDRREIDLNRREEHLIAMYERSVPLYRREPITEEELEDMKSLSRIYTQMSPEDAAERLVRLYDPRDVASILYFMGERNAASILSAMDVSYAANITEILLYS